MDKKATSREIEKRREHMIRFIIQAIQKVDDEKLRNIYLFIRHIK